MKIKSIFALFLTATLFALPQLSFASASTASGFSDVLSSNPNFTAIMGLKDRGIISGYPDGTFKPDQVVNRAEALKIILLGSGIVVPDTTGTGGFIDTQADAWYAKFILKAKALAIVEGYSDGTFKPDQTVNLAENLKILLLANKVDTSIITVNADPYADAPKGDWFAGYLQYAKDHSLIDADAQNKVYPAQGMTRGKLAETMYRLILLNEQGPQQTQQTQDNTVYMEVNIKDFAFTPQTMTIGTGSHVRWTNKDSTNHQVASDDGLFKSGTLSNGDTFVFTFDTVGVYKYHCAIHPSMTGTITVKPANEVPTI